jgi:hypothetical protein
MPKIICLLDFKLFLLICYLLSIKKVSSHQILGRDRNLGRLNLTKHAIKLGPVIANKIKKMEMLRNAKLDVKGT